MNTARIDWRHAWGASTIHPGSSARHDQPADSANLLGDDTRFSAGDVAQFPRDHTTLRCMFSSKAAVGDRHHSTECWCRLLVSMNRPMRVGLFKCITRSCPTAPNT